MLARSAVVGARLKSRAVLAEITNLSLCVDDVDETWHGRVGKLVKQTG